MQECFQASAGCQGGIYIHRVLGLGLQQSFRSYEEGACRMVHLLHGYPGRRAEEEEILERVGKVQREIVSGLLFFSFVCCLHFFPF